MINKYSKYFPNHDDFNLNDFPFYWISQVHGLYIHKMDQSLKKYGLDNSRRRIILAAAAWPDSSISHLAEMTIIKIPTATKIIYRLKDEGYLETTMCETDSRITRVRLTDKGHEMVLKINEITSILFNESFVGLKPNDIKKMNELLKIIKNNLGHVIY